MNLGRGTAERVRRASEELREFSAFILDAVAEQTEGAGELMKAVRGVRSVSEENVKTSELLKSLSAALNGESENLRAVVSQFRLE